jgi:RHS repeat-associated protein
VLFDHLGSAKLLIGTLGNVVWPRPNGQPNELLPFGKDRDFNPEQPNPVESAYKLTFTNKEIDHQTDLHYFGARYYHADLPRFISPDPVSGKLEIPTSWNRYLYCRNDPVNYFDPDGETWHYVQSTGELAHLDDNTGKVERNVASGYSGKGIHQDFPGSESIMNEGPIPSGAYRIGPQRNSSKTGPAVMDLDRLEPDYSQGRGNDFQFHGDNPCGDKSASSGCIVVGPNARNKIANSNDDLLIVVGYPSDLTHLQKQYLQKGAKARLEQAGNQFKISTTSISSPGKEEAK